jgi:hypothetical protein
VLSSFEV